MSHFKTFWMPVAFALLGIFCWMPATAHATNYTFTGLAATCPFPTAQQCATFVPGDPENWGDVRNWSPQGVPGAGDTVTIGTFSVSINGNRSVQRLTMSGDGNLRNGTLNLIGPSASFMSLWTTGTISCILNIATGAQLRISGNAVKTASVGTINNSGTVTWLNSGELRLNANAVFNNKSGGVFNAQNDSGVFFSSFGGSFNNLAGATFNKSGVGTTTTFGVLQPFNNAGTVNVTSGTLSLTQGASSGVFRCTSGAQVDFINAYTFNTGTKFGGTGCRVSNGTVTFNGTVQVEDGGNFEMPSGVVLGTAASNLITAGTGFYNWTGSDIGSNNSVLNIGVGTEFRISGNTTKQVRNGVVNNNGRVTWVNNGDLRLNDNGVFNNKSGGVFNAQNDSGVFFSSAGGSFNNLAGATFNKSGVGTTTTFGILQTFSNAGTVNVNSGTLTLDGGGISSGTFNVANGGRANVSGTLSGTLNAAEGGVIGLGSASASTALNAGTKCVGAGISKVFAGTVSIAGTVTAGSGATDPGTLVFEAGQVSGTAASNLVSAGSGLFKWTGSDIGVSGGGNVLNIGVGTEFRISGSAPKSAFAGTINNSGTVTWLNNGDLRLNNGAVFNNKSGGVFNAQNDSGVFFSSFGGSFNNLAGATFNKSGIGTTTTFGVLQPFNNSGTINALSGTLALTEGTSTGVFRCTSGAQVDFINTYTFNTGTKFGGTGCRVSNGTVTFNGTVQVEDGGNFEMPSGVVLGTAASNLTTAGTGFYHWTGSGISAVDSVLNIGVGTEFRISGNATKQVRNGIVNNNGRVTWVNNGDLRLNDNAVFNNKSGGVFNAQNDSGVFFSSAGGSFNNLAGATFNKSGAGTTTTFGILQTFSNAGTVKALSGTLSFDSDFTQTAGTTVLNGGAITASAAFKLEGGTLSGIGTLTGNVTNSGGSVSPGISAPGALSETGNYSQGANGELSIQLNGVTPVTQYDQFNVNGTVALGGALALSANFSPASGSSFTILNNDGTEAVTGTFAGLPQGASVQAGSALFRILYNGGDGNDVVLTNIQPTLSIENATISEGDSGTKNLVFTVTLSEALSQPLTVQYLTANNTATAPDDYVAIPLTTLTFSPGQTVKKIVVLLQGDTIDEADETFFVDLKNPSAATLTDSRGVGRITDDDPPPTLSISNAPAVTEGNSGTVTATFTVTLSSASSKTVTVDFATANGTAVAPGDYSARTGTLTFAPDQTSKTITVSVRGDLLDETTETFTVILSNAVNATLLDSAGTGTILDDDGPTIIINNPDSIVEGDSGTVNAVFTVRLSAASLQTVTVQFATVDFTAEAGLDYTARVGTLTFAPGETSKTIEVAVISDKENEGNEAFQVSLSNPSNGNIADGQGAVYILDDDISALRFNAPDENEPSE